MKRRHAPVGVLVLATAAGVGFAMFTNTPRPEVAVQAPVAAPDATAIDELTLVEPQACEAESTAVVAESCGRCPLEWPRCSRDRDCDSVCGGKGTGVCEWINSCFKCCTCGGST